MYVGAPVSAIMYKCKVTETDSALIEMRCKKCNLKFFDYVIHDSGDARAHLIVAYHVI